MRPADLDWDGDQDLAVANNGVNTVSVFRNLNGPSLTLGLPTMAASAGSDVTIPITVTGFIHVGSFSLTVQFNKAVLTYKGVANQPSFGVFNSTPTSTANTNGAVSLSWFNVSPALNTDPGTLLNLLFIFNRDSSDLTFINTSASSITDSIGNNLLATYTNGRIVQGTGVRVTGSVTYNGSSTPVNNVSVTITRTDVAPNAVTTLMTNTSGSYTIEPNRLTSGIYTFGFSKTGGHPTVYTNAADALKAALFSVDPVTYPLAANTKLAADVNNDGNINSADALQIMLRYVGSVTSFAKGDWIFVPTAASKTLTTADFVNNAVAIAVGDVNSDAQAGGAYFAKANGTPSIVAEAAPALKVSMTDVFEVPVRVKAAASFGSMSMAFQYPTESATFLGVRGAEGMVSAANSGVVAVAWFNAENVLKLKENDAIVTLRFKPTANVKDFSLTLDPNSQITDAMGTVLSGINIEIPAVDASIPTVFALGQNYPNPFNPTTAISFQLSAVSFVSLRVFDVLGREVSSLVDGVLPGGTYTVHWDGSEASSGVYYYRLYARDVSVGSAQTFIETKRMTLVK